MRINEQHLFLNPELRTRDQVIEQATELMSYHGLDEWKLVLDSPRISKRAGQCRYRAQEIGITEPYALKASPADLEQTIIHEIAHALTPGAHHGKIWKAKMVELGADPKRCHSCTWTAPETWIVCTLCNKENPVTKRDLKKYRIEDRVITSHSCGSCGRGLGSKNTLIVQDYNYEPKKGWIEIEHWSDQVEPDPEPTPEPVAEPDPIRCPRVSVFPSTIVQPSFLDDVPIQTFEREPGKATFIHDKSKQLSLFE
jgi:predicted SprT family Zn-dependent metalloprotease